jgi:uncharacterized protein
VNAPGHPPTAWVLTDGKAGDEAQCLGVVETMGLTPEIRRVAPRKLIALAMPWGPIDPAEAPGRARSPIAPPFPDLLVASGRRAIPYVRAVKRASAGRTFTVILKDPRIGAGAADLIWVPEHDRLRAPNVIATPTGPHRISAERLAVARAEPDPRLAALSHPRVAVLVGGDSRHHRFTPNDADRLGRDLEQVANAGASLMITASRRTPQALAERLRRIAEDGRGFYWDGTGGNPYLAMLAMADYIVVTADSTNMIGEAAATGVPVLVFEPSGGHVKISEFMAALTHQGIVRPFSGALEGSAYEPLDTTPAIAGAIAAALARHSASIAARLAG